MADQSDTLDRVRALLNEGKPQEALAALSPHLRSGSEPLVNAYAVCLMRLGQHGRAAGTLRSLAYEGPTRKLRHDLAAEVKVNLVTALLLNGQIKECRALLEQIRNDGIPAAEAIEKTIAAWRKGLSFFERLQSLWTTPRKPVSLDCPPGVV